MAKKQYRPDRVGQHKTAFEKNKQIIYKTQTVCGICGKPVDFDFKFPHPLSPTVDHIIPVSKGGDPSSLDNLQLAHRWCNRQKSNKVFTVGTLREKAESNKEVENDDLPLHIDWYSYKA